MKKEEAQVVIPLHEYTRLKKAEEAQRLNYPLWVEYVHSYGYETYHVYSNEEVVKNIADINMSMTTQLHSIKNKWWYKLFS